MWSPRVTSRWAGRVFARASNRRFSNDRSELIYGHCRGHCSKVITIGDRYSGKYTMFGSGVSQVTDAGVVRSLARLCLASSRKIGL